MRRLSLLGVAVAGALSACDFNLVPYPKVDVPYTVAPNRITCTASTFQGQSCLLIKRGEETLWRELEPPFIGGFTHEIGFRYRLLVSEQFVPPVTTYTLKQVLEKTPDATTALPGQP
ncbi:hypothetical protein DAETH_08770 [Deinococcus aetherius]|uniref:DUF4377 domain-containing protein n=2 Tax=Deinococcus aetherius TaxID=200252 RepID=A0ABM8ABC1_9DEIO|nr:DUF4377 domain-containing protein [Deinococcus aetherius]BDP40908.1 hypothetical protein DAETH_08770 [Deinococcus aetherius]